MNLQPNGFFVLTRGRCVKLREIKFWPQKFEKSTTHTVTKNVGVRKAHGLLFMGDNSKTTLKNGKYCREYSHFQWTLQRDSTPAYTHVFCLCVPAGRICKMGHVCASPTTSQQYRCGKGCLQFHRYIFHFRGRL